MTQREMQLDGHGLDRDGKSCSCGKSFNSVQEFSLHCATVQRRSEQPMDVKHTADMH